MRTEKIFNDNVSELLWKQIREAQTYIHKELDKEIIKQLLITVLSRNLLPVLTYPDRKDPYVMPMHYSKKKGLQINLHTPIPKLILYSVDQYVSTFKCDELEFQNELKSMMERVEKHG